MNKKCVWQILLLLLLVSFNGKVFSQAFQVNGTAINHSDSLVRLTQSGIGDQVGSAWSTSQINLSEPFDKTFNMFFGCVKNDLAANGPVGGDGITFTFQNQGLNALGGGGGNLGINGIPKAVSIQFDTYDNGLANNDIADDHTAISINGVVNSGPQFIGHDGTFKTVQKVSPFLPSGRDLESCADNANDFYTIRVVWTPANPAIPGSENMLQLYEEGILTMTYKSDIITTIFGGNPMVYWGFTSATASASNEQWIGPAESIIPWECKSGSCCTPFKVFPSGPTTICNDPISIGVIDTYEKYKWSTGAETPTAEITEPGIYTISVQQLQGLVLCPGDTIIEIKPTGPTATLTGGGATCPESTLPLSVEFTGAAPWKLTYTDGVTQTVVENINSSPLTIDGSPTHTYSLISVSDGGLCNGIVDENNTVDVTSYSGIPVGHDTIFVIGKDATFKVNDEDGNYVWYYPNGDPLNKEGDEILVSGLTTTTTYFVKNTAEVTKTVGLPSPGIGGSGTNPDDLFINFTAHSNFTLQEITCAVDVQLPWVDTYLSLTITDITDPTKSFTKDSLFTVPMTDEIKYIKFPINHPIIKDHNYIIRYRGKRADGTAGQGSLQGLIYWQYGSPEIPYADLTFNQTGEPKTRYPALFDWKISLGSFTSTCKAIPVTAYLCPSGDIEGESKICDNGTETTLVSVKLEPSTTAPWTINYTFNGVPQTPITNIQALPSPFTFTSQPGVGVYELTKVTKTTPPNILEARCKDNFTGTFTVGLKPLPPVGFNQTFVGPANVTLTVEEVTGASYFWYTTPTGGTPLNAVSSLSYTTPVINDTTTYYVEVTLDGYTSCSRTAVIAYESGDFLIPNLITANNDNKNDRFEIQALPNESQLQIFNRWGKKIYHDLNYKNTWGDDEVPAGVYFYDLVLPDGKAYKGWVNVVK